MICRIVLHLVVAAALAAGAWSLPGAAQDAVPLSPAAEAPPAEAAAPAEAVEVYGPQDTRAKPKCGAPGKSGEIVVCGAAEDPDKYRVKSSSDLNPAVRDGLPHAPDLFNLPQPAMVGVGVTMKGCFIPPCPAKMPLIIDLKAIPEAPAGSDADRAGRGLAPGRGVAAAQPASASPPAPSPDPVPPDGFGLTPPGSASPAAEPSG